MTTLLRRLANLEKRLAPPEDEHSTVDYSKLTPEEGQWLKDIVARTPLYEGKMDLSCLSDAELEEMERVLRKALPLAATPQ